MDDHPLGEKETRSRSGLGGFNIQTGASILLIAVIAAVLWLFLGPMPDGGQEAGLPTATTQAATPAMGVGPRVTGSPVAGGIMTPAARTTPGTSVPGAAAGTPMALGTTVAAASAALRPGMYVTVVGTDGFGLRYRMGAGADFVTIRIVDEGETLLVVGGPEQAEGARWWRLQDGLGNVGWAAEEFLRPTAAPAGWAPPAASPTFPAGMENATEP